MIENVGYAVTFAAASNKPVEGMLAPTCIFVCWPFGIWYKRYMPELTFDEIYPKDYAAIVIAGGPSPDVIKLSNNEKLLDLVREFDGDGKMVAAYAMSPLILAKVGVLKDKRYTICKGCLPKYPEAEEALEKAEKEGAILDEDDSQKTIVAGNVIIGWGPSAMEDFCDAVLKGVNYPSL